LRYRQYLSAVGIHGAGANSVHGTVALSGAGRVGQNPGIGSHPGSADAAPEAGTVVPGFGAGDEMECAIGQGMDRAAARQRTVFLLRWPCAGLPRRSDGLATPLCCTRAAMLRP